jgi:hypothetical protein
MSRRRGYFLLEAAVAGGILTVAIGTALILSATFRAAVTGAARRAEASQIAEVEFERYLAGDARSSFGPSAVAGHRGFSVSGTSTAVPVGVTGLSGTAQEVTVTVTYPVSGVDQEVSFVRWVR